MIKIIVPTNLNEDDKNNLKFLSNLDNPLIVDYKLFINKLSLNQEDMNYLNTYHYMHYTNLTIPKFNIGEYRELMIDYCLDNMTDPDYIIFLDADDSLDKIEINLNSSSNLYYPKNRFINDFRLEDNSKPKNLNLKKFFESPTRFFHITGIAYRIGYLRNLKSKLGFLFYKDLKYGEDEILGTLGYLDLDKSFYYGTYRINARPDSLSSNGNFDDDVIKYKFHRDFWRMNKFKLHLSSEDLDYIEFKYRYLLGRAISKNLENNI